METIQNKAKNGDVAAMTSASIQNTNAASSSFIDSIRGFQVTSGDLLPPHWSPQRDIALSILGQKADQWKGAKKKATDRILSAKFEVLPRDTTVRSHWRLADFFNNTIHNNSEYGQGFLVWLEKWCDNLWEQDNGTFSEIIAPGAINTPRTGVPLGLAILDPKRCQRTSNPEYPVVYHQDSGGRVAMHFSRVMSYVQQPSSNRQQNGVGHCWLTRAADNVQRLSDMARYGQEQLGSRTPPRIIVVNGVLRDDVKESFWLAQSASDNVGLKLWAKSPILVGEDGNAKVDVVDLIAPNGFNEEESMQIAMATLAVTGGFPLRDLWPSNIVARSDAEFAHITGSAGYKSVINSLIFLFSGSPTNIGNIQRFLPPELKLVIELDDKDLQERAARVEKARMETWQIGVSTEVYDDRLVRELALSVGDITPEQFSRLELEAGRLPNGESVLLLYQSTKEIMIKLLTLSVDNPTDIEANRSKAESLIKDIKAQKLITDAIIINMQSARLLRDARQARAALVTLQKEYELVLAADKLAEEVALGLESEQPKPLQVGEQPLAPNADNNLNDSNPKPDKPTTPEQNPKPSLNTEKETTGFGLPPEVNEFEAEVQDLIEQYSDGEITRADFEQQMEELVEESSTVLFLLASGSSREDLTDEERAFLGEQISISLASISGLADNIESGAFKPLEDGGRDNSAEARSLLWGGFLGGIYSAGQTFGRDVATKMRWRITPGKDHCSDCLGQNGKIRTKEDWLILALTGIYPKSPSLACHGGHCGCGFEEVL